MKKLVALALALTVGFTVQAQRRKMAKKEDRLSVEQQADLALKKMTLALDLSNNQQSKIKPLLKAQIADKRANFEKHKALKESGKKPSKEERYEHQSKMLDKQIAFKKRMKNILNDHQYERFEKMSARKKGKMKRHFKKRKMMKKRKELREQEDN